METIVNKLEIIQPICETPDSDRIIGYLDDKFLSIDFIREYQNGNVWGVYYDEDGDLVYETKDGDVYMLYEECVMISEDEKVLFDISSDECIRNPEDHAYLIQENGILKELELESDTADDGSGVFYYQGEEGALVTWADADGTENASKSGFYYTSSFEEFKEDYLDE